MTSSRTLITGAHGFVGRHLLAELGDDAVPLEADVTDLDALVRGLRDERPAAVVHLAAHSSVASSWEDEGDVWLVNTVGTVNVLSAVASEAPEARVLVVSTGDVYGRASVFPTPEDAPVQPLSPYAAAKAAAELAVDRARRVQGVDAVVVRSFSHIGPGQAEAFAVGSWAAQVARLEQAGGGALRVGDLEVRRDFTDVRDVCRAYRLLLDRKVPAGTYNVASGVAVRLAEVVEVLRSLARCPVTVEPDPERRRAADIPVQQGDAARLALATGWRPELPLGADPRRDARLRSSGRAGREDNRQMSRDRRALITGVTGQDGSYLAELLLEQGYEVFGMTRRASTENVERIGHLVDRITLVQGDLLDAHSLEEALRVAKPSEVYNLAAQSFVPTSWNQPVLTAEFTAVGVTRVLEAIRSIDPEIRLYQASSSEMFGKVREVPQNELTPFHPRSPYGVAKAYAHHITVNYRESYDLFAVSGILFNHESPRRGLEFVTRKISDGVARIKLGLAEELRLGNTEARRDWGFAGDYVRAMWLMLQQDEPRDYVVATGVEHSVQDFVDRAFAAAELEQDDRVVIDSGLLRPAEVDHLIGDASRARDELGWEPEVSFDRLVEMMVASDLERDGRGG